MSPKAKASLKVLGVLLVVYLTWKDYPYTGVALVMILIVSLCIWGIISAVKTFIGGK